MKRVVITENITYVEPDSMAGFRACAGVVVSAPAKILIDANMGEPDTLKLLEEERPDMAFISHYHLDHSSWGAAVKENTDAELFLPEKEKDYLSSLDSIVEKTAGPYGLVDEWRDFVVNAAKFREFSGFSTYSPEDEFPGGDGFIQFVATPGHSPGHTSFYFPRDRILFSGDMGVDRFGPWYGWSDCDLEDLTESLLKLKSMDIKTLITSHGGIFSSDIDSLWDKALKILLERERNIQKLLDSGKTDEEITEEGIFFKNKSKIPEPTRLLMHMWDAYMLERHIDILKRGGLRELFPELNFLDVDGGWISSHSAST